MIRSTDGGRTWSERYSSLVNSPHGPTQLRDGRLLYAGKELWTGQRRNGVAESVDDELTKAVLLDIADEEKVHAGEFLALLKTLAPDEDEWYRKGAAEVAELKEKTGR